MKTKLARDVEREEVMAAIHPCPKPGKEKKPRKAKVMPRRKMLEKQIEAVLKLLICWRDGGDCVMKSIDGVRCGNGLMWNHLIPQKQSHWLKLEIGNVFWGCGSHNMLDFHGDKTLALWFVKTFSVDALEALQAEARKHTGHKRTVQELEHLLDYYTELYQERYTAPDTIQGRMQAGYYGYIVRVSYPDNRKDFVR